MSRAFFDDLRYNGAFRNALTVAAVVLPLTISFAIGEVEQQRAERAEAELVDPPGYEAPSKSPYYPYAAVQKPGIIPWGTIVYGAAHDCYQACNGQVLRVQFDVNGAQCECQSSGWWPFAR